MSEPPSPHRTLKDLTPHVAKLAFRAFLRMFAGFWSEARANATPGSPDAARWPDYEQLLRACQDVLYHAPMHPNEAKQVHIEPRYVRSLERLATMLSHLFPNGFFELEMYVVTDDTYAWRRQSALRRYRRRKIRSRRQRSRRH